MHFMTPMSHRVTSPKTWSLTSAAVPFETPSQRRMRLRRNTAWLATAFLQSACHIFRGDITSLFLRKGFPCPWLIAAITTESDFHAILSIPAVFRHYPGGKQYSGGFSRGYGCCERAFLKHMSVYLQRNWRSWCGSTRKRALWFCDKMKLELSDGLSNNSDFSSDSQNSQMSANDYMVTSGPPVLSSTVSRLFFVNNKVLR